MKQLLSLSLLALMACATPMLGNNQNEPIEVSKSKITQLSQPKAPKYPLEAKQKHIDGDVHAIVIIGKDGRVISVHPYGGPQELYPPSIEYWMGCQFAPYIKNGEARFIKVKTVTPFRLR